MVPGGSVWGGSPECLGEVWSNPKALAVFSGEDQKPPPNCSCPIWVFGTFGTWQVVPVACKEMAVQAGLSGAVKGAACRFNFNRSMGSFCSRVMAVVMATLIKTEQEALHLHHLSWFCGSGRWCILHDVPGCSWFLCES